MVSLQALAWVGFAVFVVTALVLDLGVFHRKAHVVTLREALYWSAVWIAAAVLFNLGIFWWKGPQDALEFLTGYLIELSLSVDNLFVFLLVFTYFRVPPAYQHKVLFWGIVGALIMRGVFIASGIALIRSIEWVVYVFGAFLIFTGLKMAFQKEKDLHPEKNPVLRLFRLLVPVSERYENDKFFIRRGARFVATPLFVVVLFLETADLMFAVDSVPAILAITTKPFIVYTSNVFAIMGLRTFFFALARLIGLFRFLHYGLAAILVFVGLKMLLQDVYRLPVVFALGVVVCILTLSILVSVIWPAKKETASPEEER